MVKCAQLLRWRSLIASMLLGASSIFAGEEQDYYPIETIAIPTGLQFEVSGLAAMPDGRMAAALRKGEVWLFDADQPDSFTRFASGLHEPLGLSLHRGELYTCQRSEVTRLRDRDGDGVADAYLSVARGWGVSGNYHEYAYGPVFDRQDNLYLALNCSIGKKVVEGATAWRGWSMMKPPDGPLRPVSAGLRSPIGVGLNHHGDVFATDHQGNYFPTCPLVHIRPGVFHGHADALKSCALPGATVRHPGRLPSGLTVGEAAKTVPGYTLPAVWFPYEKTAMGVTGIRCDTTNGAFGPFAHQLFVGEFTLARVCRVYLEKVGGQYQGAVFPFREGFQCGVLCLEFDSKGRLYVGQSNRGWNSLGNRSFGLQRLHFAQVPFEIQTMMATPRGFRLQFTRPIDSASARDPKSYKMQSYTYTYGPAYGGREQKMQKHVVTVVQTGASWVDLKVEGLREAFVFELQAGVKDRNHEPLLHADAYYTLNRIPEP